MDSGTYRGVFTLVLMATFIALVFWAYSKKRKRQFDEAANLPFADEEENNATLRKESEKRED